MNRISHPWNAVAVLNGELYYSWHRVSQGRSLRNAPDASPEKDACDPLMLRVHGDKLFACTTTALWRLEPKKLEESNSAGKPGTEERMKKEKSRPSESRR